MTRTAFIVALVSVVTGCVSNGQLRPMTAGAIGCTPQDTVVFNRQTHWSSSTWQATCGDDAFYSCTGTDGEMGSQITCSQIPPERVTPELRASAAQAQAR